MKTVIAIVVLLSSCIGCSTARTVKDSLTVDPKPFTVAPDGRVTGSACFRSDAHE